MWGGANGWRLRRVTHAAFVVLCVLVLVLWPAGVEAAEDVESPVARRAVFERFLAEDTPLRCDFAVARRSSRYLNRLGQDVPPMASSTDDLFLLGDWINGQTGTWSTDGVQWRIDVLGSGIALSDGEMTLGLDVSSRSGGTQPGDKTQALGYPQNIMLWAAGRPLITVLRRAARPERGKQNWVWAGDADTGVSRVELALNSMRPCLPSHVSVDYADDHASRVVIRVLEWCIESEGLVLPKTVVREHSLLVAGRRRIIAEQRAVLTGWLSSLQEDRFVIDLPRGLRLLRLDGSAWTIGTDAHSSVSIVDQMIGLHVASMRDTLLGVPPRLESTDFHSLARVVGDERIKPVVSSPVDGDRCGEACVSSLLAWFGRTVPVQEVVDRYSPEPAMSPREMQNALTDLGVRSDWRTLRAESASQLVSLDGPFILQLQASKPVDSHFVFAAVPDQSANPSMLLVYDHPHPTAFVGLKHIRRRLLSGLLVDADLEAMPADPRRGGSPVKPLLVGLGLILVIISVFLQVRRRARVRASSVAVIAGLSLVLALSGCGRSSTDASSLELSPGSMIDLGTVAPGESAVARFSVRELSDSEHPREVLQVISSCGCLEVSPSSGSIRRGQALEFSARVVLRGRGARQEHARILLNRGDVLDITFSATVVPPPQVSLPGRSIVGSAGSSHSVELPVKVYWPQGGIPPSHLEVVCQALSLRKRYDLDVPGAPIDATAGLCSIDTVVRFVVRIPPANAGRVVQHVSVSGGFGRVIVPIATRSDDAYVLLPGTLFLHQPDKTRKVVLRRLAADQAECITARVVPADMAEVAVIRVGRAGYWEILLSPKHTSQGEAGVLHLVSSIHPDIQLPLRRKASE